MNALSEQDQKAWSARWTTPGWLPSSIGIAFTPTDGNIRCAEDNLDRLIAQAKPGEVIYYYDLVGVVAQIYSTKECRSHLVAMVNGKGSFAENAAVGLTCIIVHSADASPESDQWHLFNDFTVQELTAKEALHFDPLWKTPVILVYQVRHRRERDIEGHPIDFRKFDDNWKTSLDPSCLYDAGSL